MSYADDVGAFTYGTGSTTIGAGFASVWPSKQFLKFLSEDLQLHKFAQQRSLPEGNGKTIEFYRPRALSPETTALTEGVNPSATKIYGQTIQAAIEEWGAWTQISSLLRQGHIDQNLISAVKILSAQAAETVNLRLLKEICSNGIYLMPADESATSQYDGALTTVTSTVSMASTGLAANTNYGDANDDLNQSIMTMTSGPAKGESRVITNYVTSGGVITVTSAFNMTPEVGDTFHVCTPDEITTADDLSYSNLKAARTLLIKHHAQRFRPTSRFACILGPDQMKNLQDDTDWKAVQTYKNKYDGLTSLYAGAFAGFDLYETTVPFQFPITTRGTAGTSYGPGDDGANYSTASTSTVQIALCFGQDSFGVTKFSKKNGVMKPPVRVKGPNRYDKFDVLDRFTAVGWHVDLAVKALYSLHNIGIATYYS
jgi:N4-gp56 family major capsid protein